MPSDPKTPAQLASAAADSINALNHATIGPGQLDWEYPSHTYTVLGSLERMSGGLPQAMEQVRSLLSGLFFDGHVGSTTGSAEQKVTEAIAALDDARAAAAQLNSALQRAHNATSPLTYED